MVTPDVLPIELIVGLGNPGPQYINTRHNVGAWFVDYLAEQHPAPWHTETKFSSEMLKIQTPKMYWLAKPLTFMNDSGRAVAAITRYYKIPTQAILIVHDELDFPAGTIRLKSGGGHGGHNGLRSIIQHLQSPHFMRLRIGIDHPGHKTKVSPYVLASPSNADKQKINQSFINAACAMPALLAGDEQQAFRLLHEET